MRPLSLSQIAEWTGGRLQGADAGGRDVLIDRVVTDTRDFDAGDGRAALFVALEGERFDGHDHVADAGTLGARAALVSRPIDTDLPQVVVADTERALGSLAAALQRARAATVVAITGSNGKTSVKTLVQSILAHAAAADGRVAYANPGNRNNEIGLPLAVIDAPDDAAFAVYEMGAGKPGDIAYLTAIARPDVSLVNNVAAAHLERLGSLDGVADTKGAIYDALAAGGVAVINADDAFAARFGQRVAAQPGRRVIRFGMQRHADVSARDLRLDDAATHFTLVTPAGDANVVVSMPGRHNVCNALAAAAIALACGIGLAHICAGLRDARAVSGRLVRHRLANGATLIDDSYNANPGSLEAAIDTLAAAAGERWLVLGDMRELGADAAAMHAAAGTHAKQAGIDRLYAQGSLSAHAAAAFGAGGRTFATHDAVVAALRVDLHAGVRVLVKGSRGSAMDRIVDALLGADAASQSTATHTGAGAHAA